MSWYLGQFWWLLVPSFVLGVLVGYWWWRRQFTRTSVSAATSTQGSCGHGPLLAEKDAEIERLQAAASGIGTAGTAAATGLAGDVDGDADGPGLLDGVADATQDAKAGIAGAAGVATGAAGTLAGRVADKLDGDDDAHGVTDGEAAHLVDGSVDPDAEGSVVDAAGDADVEGPTDADGSVDGDVDGDVDGSVHGDVDGSVHGDGIVADSVVTDSVVTAEGGILDDAEATTRVHLSDSAAAAGPAPEVGDASDSLAAGTDHAADTEHGVAAGLAATGRADAAPDDLERVEGIGPRIAGALKAAGIHTFRGLSEADVATLQSALEAGGLRFAPSLPTWARQAKLLADGDEPGFKALTDRLVAGRDTGSNG